MLELEREGKRIPAVILSYKYLLKAVGMTDQGLNSSIWQENRNRLPPPANQELRGWKQQGQDAQVALEHSLK